jgi:hypothetical protein
LALRISPHSYLALTTAADQALNAGDLATAEANARAALRQAPFNAAPLRTLGYVASIRGDGAAAARWIGLAAALGRRDTSTQLWIINALITAGDVKAAAPRIVALLRRDQLVGPMGRLFNQVATTRAGRDTMIPLMQGKGDWPARILPDMALLTPEQMAGRERLIEALDAAGRPLSRPALLPFVDRLVRAKQVDRARAVWRRHARIVPAAIGPAGLYDGGFDHVDVAAPFSFEWRIAEFAGSNRVGSIYAEEDGNGGGLLHVQSDSAPSGVLARQIVPLVPGDYRFSVTAEGSGGINLRWTAMCEKPGMSLPMRPEGSAATGRIAYRLWVPAGCVAVQILLQGSPLGTSSGTDMRYDDAALERVSTPA